MTLAPIWLTRAHISGEGQDEGDGETGERALAQPATLYALGQRDLYHLAAVYAAEILKAAPSGTDYRLAAREAARIFLELNGWRVDADAAAADAAITALEADPTGLAPFAAWLEAHSHATVDSPGDA